MERISLEMWPLILGGSILISAFINFIWYRKMANLIWAQRIKNRNLWRKNLSAIIEDLGTVLKEAENFSRNFSKFLEERKEVFLSGGRRKDGPPTEIVAQRADSTGSYYPAANSLKQKVAEIQQLAAGGWGVADIAWQLGLSREEVQLILHLSQNIPN